MVLYWKIAQNDIPNPEAVYTTHHFFLQYAKEGISRAQRGARVIADECVIRYRVTLFLELRHLIKIGILENELVVHLTFWSIQAISDETHHFIKIIKF